MEQVMSGTYTIVNPKTQGYRTIRLNDDTSWMSDAPPAGTRIVEHLNGPDNETSFRGFGFVRPDGTLSVWKSKTHLTDYIAAAKYLLAKGVGQEDTFGKAYAVRSGRCYLCTHKLTTPTSVRYGYGPECARTNALPYENQATPRVSTQRSTENAQPVAQVTPPQAQLSADDSRTSHVGNGKTHGRIGWQRITGSPRTYEQLFGRDDDPQRN